MYILNSLSANGLHTQLRPYIEIPHSLESCNIRKILQWKNKKYITLNDQQIKTQG